MKIVQEVKELNLISQARLTFGDGRFCVQLCIETLSKRATSVAHLTNISFELFYETFTEDVSLLLLYHGAKTSKMTKNSNQGGPALKCTVKLPVMKISSLWNAKIVNLQNLIAH